MAFYKRLMDVEAGRAVVPQVVTDVGFAGLIERSGRAVVLTAFGSHVLHEWRRLSIANVDPDFEVARAAVMIRAGLDHDVLLFRRLYERWLRLVALRPAAYWLQSNWRLTLPEYLDQPDALGFNPFAMMAATNGGAVGDQADWEAWAAVDVAMKPHIDVMIGRTDNRRGRLEFCQALELVRLSETDPDSMVPTIMTWSIP